MSLDRLIFCPDEKGDLTKTSYFNSLNFKGVRVNDYTIYKRQC